MIHTPVLVKEVLLYIEGGVWVDATVGTGGHTEAILDRFSEIFIFGVDVDGEALKVARERLERFKGRFRLIHGNFRNLDKLIPCTYNGVLFDIGLSSFQLDDRSRGFSFRYDGPLDMRMDRLSGLSLKRRIRHLNQKEIEDILRMYGEEPHARGIAKTIYNLKSKIETTVDLRDVVGKDPRVLSRVFQAFRIYLNDELENLRRGLSSALSKLEKGGRIIVISYHSLEDRIVKKFFNECGALNVLTKKPLRPTQMEVRSNYRSRSAKMRVSERV